MKAEEVAAVRLFTPQQQLQIPRWQRRYSWDSGDWGELWRDIERLLEEPADSPTTHFLGSFVLKVLPWSGMPSEATRFLVVDGQQRMTTLTVLIAAMRDEKSSRYDDATDQNKVKDQLTRQLLRNAESDEPYRPRLVLQEPDDTELTRIIDGPRQDSSSGVAKAYGFFRERVEELDADTLDRLLSVIQKRLTGVWVTLEESDNAHRVFQTLNAGGKPLRQGDLVRNYFFLLLGDKGESFYTEHWFEMESSLGASGLESFFAAWCISEGHQGSKRSLFRYFHKDLSPIESDVDKVHDYGVDLTSTTPLYQTMIGEREESDKRVAAILSELQAWGMDVPAGVVLTLYRLRQAGRIESEHLASALELILSFMARRFIAGFEPNLHRSIFIRAAQRLAGNEEDTGDDLVEMLHVYLSRLHARSIWPRDQLMMDRSKSTEVYMSSRSGWAFSVLEHINASMFKNAKQSPGKLQRTKYQVEHVMPQKLTGGWDDDLRSWGVENVAEFHQTYLHTIGNLSLSAINPELSNMRLEEKKEEMADDWLPLNKDVLAAEMWTQHGITERSRRLVQQAIKVYAAPMTEEELEASKFTEPDEVELEEELAEDLEDDT